MVVDINVASAFSREAPCRNGALSANVALISYLGSFSSRDPPRLYSFYLRYRV